MYGKAFPASNGMNKNSAVIILRWGLAFTFFYAAIASLVNPDNWIGYLPAFVGDIVPPRLALTIFSFYEIVLAALLFAGWKIRWAALLSVVTLAGITVFNLTGGTFDITFRDVGLAFAALALWELVKKEKGGGEEIV